MERLRTEAHSMRHLVFALFALVLLVAIPVASLAMTTPSRAVAYSPPNMTIVSPAQLKHYYEWRYKMDWLLAPIYTRADLKKYLKSTATSDSPLDALPPDARQRFLSSIQFGPYGAAISYYGDLQYLSTEQVYKILALFGEQSLTLEFTGGAIRPASPQAPPEAIKPSSIQKLFTRFWKAANTIGDETRSQRSQRVAHSYEQLFSAKQDSESVKRVGNYDLRLLFRAAAIAARYDGRYIKDAQMDFAEMEKRHFAGPPDYEQMYKALVQARLFSAAHKFYETHLNAGLTPFPAYRDEADNIAKDTPTVLVVSTTKNELIRRPADLDKAAQIVILTDPNCHFCAVFDHVLKSRPKLRAALQEHALWVTPPGSELEFATLQEWNKAHPKQQLSIMYSLQGWPMVKRLAVPQFFFLRNGTLVKHYVGWDKDSKFTDLISDLKAIELWH